MERLNKVLYEISPRITGMTQITTAWMDEATSSTLKAAFYIAAAVLIFLFISLRSIRYTLLAAAPLIIGMIWMLGLYPLVGMKLNILNIIMIPLVIGMGIDFGIHLSHRFQPNWCASAFRNNDTKRPLQAAWRAHSLSSPTSSMAGDPHFDAAVVIIFAPRSFEPRPRPAIRRRGNGRHGQSG